MKKVSARGRSHDHNRPGVHAGLPRVGVPLRGLGRIGGLKPELVCLYRGAAKRRRWVGALRTCT